MFSGVCAPPVGDPGTHADVLAGDEVELAREPEAVVAVVGDECC